MIMLQFKLLNHCFNRIFNFKILTHWRSKLRIFKWVKQSLSWNCCSLRNIYISFLTKDETKLDPLITNELQCNKLNGVHTTTVSVVRLPTHMINSGNSNICHQTTYSYDELWQHMLEIVSNTLEFMLIPGWIQK